MPCRRQVATQGRERASLRETSKHRCRIPRSFLTKTGKAHRSVSYWNRANEAATRGFLATHTGTYLQRIHVTHSYALLPTHPPSFHDRRPQNESKRMSRQRRGCLRDARCGVRATSYDFLASRPSRLSAVVYLFVVYRWKDIHRVF